MTNIYLNIYFQTEVISQGADKKLKICVIDEEQDEIRLQNQEEFDLNVKVKKIFFIQIERF